MLLANATRCPPAEPLLAGELAERARVAVDSIAAALAEPRVIDHENVSLSTGIAGVALFHAHHAWFAGGDEAMDRAVSLVQRCASVAAEGSLAATLHGGWLSIAWLVEHVFRALLAQAEDLNADADAEVLAVIDVDEPLPYELMYGLAGAGVYALARPAGSAAAERILPCILDQLDRQAQAGDGGITWFTPPAHLVGDMPEVAPRGLYNTGYAHGLGGLLEFLTRAARHPSVASRARPLVRGLARWLLSKRLAGPFAFAAWSGDGVRPYGRNERLAWCYGDLPLALALVDAGAVLGDADIEKQGLDVALACASPDRRADLVDIGLCHGATGVAHMFHRLYQRTGAAALGAAARRYFAIALDEFYVPGEGTGGVRAYLWPAARELGLPGPWVPMSGLLLGAAGVGLTLMTALRSDLPAWDAPMLLD
jgi:hypothetical protein